MNTDDLIRRALDHAAANATDVRCPTCGAAEGFYCRVPNRLGEPFKNIRANAPHAERVAISKEATR